MVSRDCVTPHKDRCGKPRILGTLSGCPTAWVRYWCVRERDNPTAPTMLLVEAALASRSSFMLDPAESRAPNPGCAWCLVLGAGRQPSLAETNLTLYFRRHRGVLFQARLIQVPETSELGSSLERGGTDEQVTSRETRRDGYGRGCGCGRTAWVAVAQKNKGAGRDPDARR